MGRPPKDGKSRPCRLRAHVTQEVYDATEDLRQRNEFSAWLDDLLRAQLIESRSVDERRERKRKRRLEEMIAPVEKEIEQIERKLDAHKEHQLRIEHWEETRDEFRSMVAEHAKNRPDEGQWRHWAEARAKQLGLEVEEALAIVAEETGIEVTA